MSIGQPFDGTATAVKALEDAAQGVKVTVEEVIAWAEKKVEKLGAETDDEGPYTSHATCAPSDLDLIGSGVLAAVPAQESKRLEESSRKESEGDMEEVIKVDDDGHDMKRQ